MSPLAHVTDVDHGGGVDEEVTADHEGSPERLECVTRSIEGASRGVAYLIDVTSQPRATADLQIRDPKKPFPPATTMFFFTFLDMMMNWSGIGSPHIWKVQNRVKETEEGSSD
jgi:hypothetical protein